MLPPPVSFSNEVSPRRFSLLIYDDLPFIRVLVSGEAFVTVQLMEEFGHEEVINIKNPFMTAEPLLEKRCSLFSKIGQALLSSILFCCQAAFIQIYIYIYFSYSLVSMMNNSRIDMKNRLVLESKRKKKKKKRQFN